MKEQRENEGKYLEVHEGLVQLLSLEKNLMRGWATNAFFVKFVGLLHV